MSVGSLTDIVQSMSGAAGTANFDGLLPSGALTTSNGQFVFAADVHQGLIDPKAMGINGPLRIDRLQLVVAGTSTWTINLVLAPGQVNQVSTGTTANFTQEGVGYLMPGQQLQVLTTGAATTSVYMVATVSNPNMFVLKT